MDENRTATTHSLERTSPLGQSFVGRCILCGATGLTMGAALKECPNLLRHSQGSALLAAIDGDDTEVQDGE